MVSALPAGARKNIVATKAAKRNCAKKGTRRQDVAERKKTISIQNAADRTARSRLRNGAKVSKLADCAACRTALCRYTSNISLTGWLVVASSDSGIVVRTYS